MKKSIILMLLFSLVLVLNTQRAMAESYQFELNGQYIYEKSDDFKSHDYLLGAVINFQEVNLDSGPYQEAAFLQKTGYFGFSGDMGKYKEGKGELDLAGFSAELKYVFPVVPLFIKLSFARDIQDGDFEDTDDGYLVDYKMAENTFSGEAGFYVVDGLAIAVTYEKGKADRNFDEPYIDTIIKNEIYGANFKYVVMFNDQMGINLAGSYKHQTKKTTVEDSEEFNETEKNKIYIAEADLYLTPKFSIGGSAEFNRGDNKFDEGNTYKGDFKLFLTPNAGLSAGYGVFKPKDSGLASDEKLYMAAFTLRM